MNAPLSRIAVGIVLLTSPLLAFVAPQQPQGAAQIEYRVKAAYLLRFVQFTRWPEERFATPDQPIRIGVIGDPFGALLDSTVASRRAQNRSIEIHRLTAEEALTGTDLLFVGRVPDRDRRQILRRAAELDILTVGEEKGFLNDGGGIALLRVGETIRFSVNLKAAQPDGIRLDARALAIAYAVYER